MTVLHKLAELSLEGIGFVLGWEIGNVAYLRK